MNSLQQQKFCKKRKASHVEYSFVLFFFYETPFFKSEGKGWYEFITVRLDKEKIYRYLNLRVQNIQSKAKLSTFFYNKKL